MSRRSPDFTLNIDTYLNGLPRMPYPDVMPEANGKRFRPYSAWPRCTRWVSYRQTKNEAGERIQGVWRFTSVWLTSHVVLGAISATVENYWDETLARWLRQRDENDDRVTRLPDDWSIVAALLAIYAEDGDCRAFCLSCGRNVPSEELQFKNFGGELGDRGTAIRCANGHLLLDKITIHRD